MRQNACSREDYWTKRSLLLGFLKPNNQPIGSGSYGALRKKFPDGSMRDIDVVIEQGPIFQARDLTKWDEWGFTEALRFIAHDPTFYDPVEKSLLFDNLDELSESSFLIFSFSFSFILGSYTSAAIENLTYTGTWMAYPRIVITGPATNMVITNMTTSEIIEINYNIAAGEIVTVDLAFGNKTVVNNSGRDLSGIVSLPSNLDTFHLAPDPEATGGVNEIYINSTGIDINSSVEIFYKERFIGI